MGTLIAAILSFSVRSGRFETFIHLYERSHPDEIFHVADVNSLYANCAKENAFPIGPFTIESDLSILSKIEYNRAEKCHQLKGKKMIGLAHIRIVAPPILKEPFLGEWRNEKFIYGLCSKCIQSQSQKS